MSEEKIINAEKEKHQTSEQTATVPYIVYEQSEFRHERRDKRNFWLIIVLIALLFGTNLAWLLYEMQWQVVETVTTTEIEASQDGENNYAVGGDLDFGTNSENQDNYNN